MKEQVNKLIIAAGSTLEAAKYMGRFIAQHCDESIIPLFDPPHEGFMIKLQSAISDAQKALEDLK